MQNSTMLGTPQDQGDELPETATLFDKAAAAHEQAQYNYQEELIAEHKAAISDKLANFKELLLKAAAEKKTAGIIEVSLVGDSYDRTKTNNLTSENATKLKEYISQEIHNQYGIPLSAIECYLLYVNIDLRKPQEAKANAAQTETVTTDNVKRYSGTAIIAGMIASSLITFFIMMQFM